MRRGFKDLRVALLVSGAIVLAMFGASAWRLRGLQGDEQAPMHYFRGEPTRYGEVYEVLWALPAVAVALLALLGGVIAFETRRRQSAWSQLERVLLFAIPIGSTLLLAGLHARGLAQLA